MRSFLLSVLAQRFRIHDADIFRTANPWDWLVWEAGSAKSPEVAAHSAGRAEPLALALTARDESTHQVTLGRGISCDLVISDRTLSSLHLLFMLGPKGWTVRDAGSRNGSRLGGERLEPGVPVPLISGAQVQAGSVLLTFYEPEALLRRVQAL